MNLITRQALVAFRAVKANEYRAQQLRISSLASQHENAIAVDKMIDAGLACHAAHDEVCAAMGWDIVNPETILSADVLGELRKALGDQADNAYAYFEGVAEAKAAAAFERQAYGRD